MTDVVGPTFDFTRKYIEEFVGRELPTKGESFEMNGYTMIVAKDREDDPEKLWATLPLERQGTFDGPEESVGTGSSSE